MYEQFVSLDCDLLSSNSSQSSSSIRTFLITRSTYDLQQHNVIAPLRTALTAPPRSSPVLIIPISRPLVAKLSSRVLYQPRLITVSHSSFRTDVVLCNSRYSHSCRVLRQVRLRAEVSQAQSQQRKTAKLTLTHKHTASTHTLVASCQRRGRHYSKQVYSLVSVLRRLYLCAAV